MYYYKHSSPGVDDGGGVLSATQHSPAVYAVMGQCGLTAPPKLTHSHGTNVTPRSLCARAATSPCARGPPVLSDFQLECGMAKFV